MQKPAQRIIGLTGGIGTGKSTVTRYLEQVHQLPVLDADLYAREAVQSGSPILQTIFERYGHQLQREDGSLDRRALGEIVFHNPQERRWLEQQIHPYVRDRFVAQLAALSVPTVILAIPLLFEAKMTDLVTEIWVVVCTHEQQLVRLQKRDRLSREQAQARINSQMPLAQKIAAADWVLDNSSTVESLLRQVDAALDKQKKKTGKVNQHPAYRCIASLDR